MTDQKELPRYRSHKIVHALKISSVEMRADGGDLYPADEGYASFEVSADWLSRYKGSTDDSGYYVVYDGGYASWSPTKAFRDGYTLIDRWGHPADVNEKTRPIRETSDISGRITRSYDDSVDG